MFEKVNTQNPGAGEEKQRRACPAPPAPGRRSDPGGPSAGVPRTRAQTGSGRPGRTAAPTGDDPPRGDGRGANPGPGAVPPTASGAATLKAPRLPPPQRGPDGGPRHTTKFRGNHRPPGSSRSPPPAEPRGAEARRGAKAQSDGRAPAQAQALGQFNYRFWAGGLGAVAEKGRALDGRDDPPRGADADACEPGPRAYRLMPAAQGPLWARERASRRRRAAPAISREPGRPPEAARTWQLQTRSDRGFSPWPSEQSAEGRGREEERAPASGVALASRRRYHGGFVARSALASEASTFWKEVKRVDFVYLVAYRKPGEDSRCVLECSAFQDVINAILSLWGDDCCQFEVFRATAL